ncbi:MAG: hypothetical protein HY079_09530 [Elusimicrobia bacterium]|nr:hypothetical protein [Elusimicrobiota bacterium]
MAPLALLLLALPVLAQDDDRSAILARISALKAQSASAPKAAPAAAAEPVLHPRSDVRAYMAMTGDYRVFYRRGYYKAPDDDAKKLQADADLAVKAFEKLTGKTVTHEDSQTFASMDFFMRTGEAAFNPNRAQTAKLQSALDGLMAGGPVLQTDLVYEALKATDGNLTLAMGSLAELFCARRNEWIPKVADMADYAGKNYYRYAGFFIGLHGWTTRALGRAGSYANMGGNPVVYAGYEVYAWWRDTLTGQPTKSVDTLKTLGPDGNGDLVDKGGELHKGFDAAEAFRSGR